MAGDWIGFDHDLPEKPEVLGIHERTGVPIDTILGRLFFLWRLADRQTVDGVIPFAGPAAIACRCGGDAAFWLAVADVGWLVFAPEAATIPDFSERFGRSARARMKDAVRKFEGRHNRTTTGQRPDNNRTRPGQVKDPVSVSISHKKESGFAAPLLSEVTAYCQERKNSVDPQEFLDYYQARGWKYKAGQPMKDWKAAVRTWEKKTFRQDDKPAEDTRPPKFLN